MKGSLMPEPADGQNTKTGGEQQKQAAKPSKLHERFLQGSSKLNHPYRHTDIAPRRNVHQTEHIEGIWREPVDFRGDQVSLGADTGRRGLMPVNLQLSLGIEPYRTGFQAETPLVIPNRPEYYGPIVLE